MDTRKCRTTNKTNQSQRTFKYLELRGIGEINMILSTVCYIEKDGKYLMLHRTKKKNDINKDKWIGIGGKIEDKESPEESVL